VKSIISLLALTINDLRQPDIYIYVHDFIDKVSSTTLPLGNGDNLEELHVMLLKECCIVKM
jgi:hypothetical protein